jgi:hypothetical protein
MRVQAFAGRIVRLGVVWGAWIAMTVSAQAVTITSVMAPDVLTRPNNGRLFPFTILVSGNYGPLDLDPDNPPVLSAQYWDQDRFVLDVLDLDDEIDLEPKLNVPPAPPTAAAGTPWGPVSVDFNVGCVGGEVFGPSGRTGENPMDDGYFFFPDARSRSWGYNEVKCEGTAPTTGQMKNLGLLSNVPLEGPAIPEPSSFLLLGGGLLGLVGGRRRHTRTG